MRRRKKVLVVEDHPLFSLAIGGIVAQVDPAAEVRSAPSLADALAALAQGDPDLVLLDLNLPDVSGLAAVTALRDRLPEAPILVISASEDAVLRREIGKAGIRDFIPKTAASAQIVASIRQAIHGGGGPALGSAPAMALSQRQLEVLREMATGKANKEIARSLGISIDTVRAHVVEILARLGVRNRTEAVRVFFSGRYAVQAAARRPAPPSSGD